jgi:predicted ChrR family anti-sigma factor
VKYHPDTVEECTERAALYTLGALSQHEARAFEEHLSEGCEACAAEREAFDGVVSSLAFGVREVDPPTEIREKLMARLGEETRATSSSDASSRPNVLQDFATLRADEGEWIKMSRNIFFKQLYVDRESGMVTTLVKMLPGTRIPMHRHLGVEQCYVIEGDFHADNQTLGPGDFHLASAGSIHEPVYTETGALLLIIAPKGYEVLEQRA